MAEEEREWRQGAGMTSVGWVPAFAGMTDEGRRMMEATSHHLLLQLYQVVNLLLGVEEMGADAQVADAAQGAH